MVPEAKNFSPGNLPRFKPTFSFSLITKKAFFIFIWLTFLASREKVNSRSAFFVGVSASLNFDPRKLNCSCLINAREKVCFLAFFGRSKKRGQATTVEETIRLSLSPPAEKQRSRWINVGNSELCHAEINSWRRKKEKKIPFFALWSFDIFGFSTSN